MEIGLLLDSRECAERFCYPNFLRDIPTHTQRFKHRGLGKAVRELAKAEARKFCKLDLAGWQRLVFTHVISPLFIAMVFQVHANES
jgi:hypothetical protein